MIHGSIITYLVSHIRKTESSDSIATHNDLRGSASISQESNAILFIRGNKEGHYIDIDLSRMSRSKLNLPIIFDGPTGVITDDMNRDVMHLGEPIPDEVFDKEININKE